jgi:hypothetical protein
MLLEESLDPLLQAHGPLPVLCTQGRASPTAHHTQPQSREFPQNPVAELLRHLGFTQDFVVLRQLVEDGGALGIEHRCPAVDFERFLASAQVAEYFAVADKSLEVLGMRGEIGLVFGGSTTPLAVGLKVHTPADDSLQTLGFAAEAAVPPLCQIPFEGLNEKGNNHGQEAEKKYGQENYIDRYDPFRRTAKRLLEEIYVLVGEIGRRNDDGQSGKNANKRTDAHYLFRRPGLA